MFPIKNATGVGLEPTIFVSGPQRMEVQAKIGWAEALCNAIELQAFCFCWFWLANNTQTKYMQLATRLRVRIQPQKNIFLFEC